MVSFDSPPEAALLVRDNGKDRAKCLLTPAGKGSVFGHIYVNSLESDNFTSHDVPWVDIQRYIRNFLHIRIRSLQRRLAMDRRIMWKEHEEMKSLLNTACQKQLQQLHIDFIPPIDSIKDINNTADNSCQPENDFDVAADGDHVSKLRMTDKPNIVDVLPSQNRIVVDLTDPARLSILDRWASSSGTVDTFIHPCDEFEFSFFLSSDDNDDNCDDIEHVGNLSTRSLGWWDRPLWAWNNHEEVLARGAIIAGELVTSLRQYLIKISSDGSFDPFISILHRANLELTVTESPSIPTNLLRRNPHKLSGESSLTPNQPRFYLLIHDNKPLDGGTSSDGDEDAWTTASQTIDDLNAHDDGESKKLETPSTTTDCNNSNESGADSKTSFGPSHRMAVIDPVDDLHPDDDYSHSSCRLEDLEIAAAKLPNSMESNGVTSESQELICESDGCATSCDEGKSPASSADYVEPRSHGGGSAINIKDLDTRHYPLIRDVPSIVSPYESQVSTTSTELLEQDLKKGTAGQFEQTIREVSASNNRSAVFLDKPDGNVGAFATNETVLPAGKVLVGVEDLCSSDDENAEDEKSVCMHSIGDRTNGFMQHNSSSPVKKTVEVDSYQASQTESTLVTEVNFGRVTGTDFQGPAPHMVDSPRSLAAHIDSHGLDWAMLSQIPAELRSEARLALAVARDAGQSKRFKRNVPSTSKLYQWLSTPTTKKRAKSTFTDQALKVGSNKRSKHSIDSYFKVGSFSSTL